MLACVEKESSTKPSMDIPAVLREVLSCSSQHSRITEVGNSSTSQT